MNVAAKVREEKEQHPERFCNARVCLWRVRHLDGRETPCPKHAALAKEGEGVGAPSSPAASAEPYRLNGEWLETWSVTFSRWRQTAEFSGYTTREERQGIVDRMNAYAADNATHSAPATRSGR